MPTPLDAAPIDPSFAFAMPGRPALEAADWETPAPQLVVPDLLAETEVTTVRH